jgi:hypothetical protein
LVEKLRLKAWRLDDYWKRRDENPDWDLTIPFYTDRKWPDAFGIRFRAKGVGGSIADAEKAPGTPSWHWELLDGTPRSTLAPALDVPLRSGEKIEFEISSSLPNQIEAGPRNLIPVADCLAIIQETVTLLKTHNTNLVMRDAEAFTDGTHRMVSPTHTLTVVNAVRKPHLTPEFGNSFTIQRVRLNDPVADIAGEIPTDWYSTARLTCIAKWTDWVDDVSKPAPEQVENNEIAFEIKATDADRTPSARKHKFRDTSFHSVEYTMIATSRFREFYPDSKEEPKFQLHGKNSLTLPVHNSERPGIPSIVYVIPSFGWDGDKDFDSKTNIKRRVRTGALRVYLGRPWSGNNVRLGVIYPKSESANDPKLLEFVTQWGVDPIWKSQTLPQFIKKTDFCGYQDSDDGCLLMEFPEDKTRLVNVVGYEVKYDNARRLWFTDIEIDPQKSYFPFVRLALVRYQPKSWYRTDRAPLEDARISPVAISDFAQLTPNRWAHVHKVDHKTVNLCVSGVSYDSASEGKQGPSVLQVSIQQRWHRVEGSVGWITTKGPMRDFQVDTKAGVTTWQKTLQLDHSNFWYKYRLLIEEFDQIYGDGDGTLNSKRNFDQTYPAERLVYADTFEL